MNTDHVEVAELRKKILWQGLSELTMLKNANIDNSASWPTRGRQQHHRYSF
jgi:hypothetical protein